MIRVLIGNEYRHERQPGPAHDTYPEGIHKALADALGTEEDLVIKTACLDDPDCGITKEILAETDVLHDASGGDAHVVPEPLFGGEDDAMVLPLDEVAGGHMGAGLPRPEAAGITVGGIAEEEGAIGIAVLGIPGIVDAFTLESIQQQSGFYFFSFYTK